MQSVQRERYLTTANTLTGAGTESSTFLGCSPAMKIAALCIYILRDGRYIPRHITKHISTSNIVGITGTALVGSTEEPSHWSSSTKSLTRKRPQDTKGSRPTWKSPTILVGQSGPVLRYAMMMYKKKNSTDKFNFPTTIADKLETQMRKRGALYKEIANRLSFLSNVRNYVVSSAETERHSQHS